MTSEIIDIFDVQIEAPEQFDVVVEQTEVNLEPLTITENGVYTPQGSATGFSKVEANVLPKSTDIVITENGEYHPNDYEVDAFVNVGVDVKPKLVEITATDNGTYTPSEGFDGFGKVNVDLQGKVKLDKFNITNNCINEEGRWEGEEFIGKVNSLYQFANNCSKLKELNANHWDVSSCTDLTNAFNLCSSLHEIHISNWDVSSCTKMHTTFQGCSSLEDLSEISNWDVSNVTNFYRVFNNCSKLKILDLRLWDCSNCTAFNQVLNQKTVLTLIGGVSIEDVIVNNIGCLNGLSVSTQMQLSTGLDRASLRALINGLADLTDTTTQTLTLGATLRAKLTEKDIAIAVGKNWTLS